MKTIQVKLVAMAMVMSALAVAAYGADKPMPRSEWHAQVGVCAADAAKLKDVISKIGPSEQCAFAAEVIGAIEKMPGSDEMKAARSYAASRALVVGVKKDMRVAMLAEVFATVPPAYLTYVNERFATELFNRNGNPNRTFSDAEYTDIAKHAMETVIARCQKAENPDVRTAFAILMFVRASGGTPGDLAQTLVNMMPSVTSHETIMREWFTPALAEGADKTYDPMLGAARAGDEPNHEIVTRIIGGPAIGYALQADLQNEGSSLATSARNIGAGSFTPPTISGLATDTNIQRLPRTAILSPAPVGKGFHLQRDGTYKDANGEVWHVQPDGSLVSDSGETISNPYYQKDRGQEPTPYPGQ